VYSKNNLILVENIEITIKYRVNLSKMMPTLGLKLIILVQQILHFDTFKLNSEITQVEVNKKLSSRIGIREKSFCRSLSRAPSINIPSYYYKLLVNDKCFQDTKLI
jgi:hypothetical protein